MKIYALALACSVLLGPGNSPAAGIIDYRLAQVDGEINAIGMSGGKPRPVALVFLDPICPISRKYVPHLNRTVAPAAATAGVDFRGVISSPSTSVAESREFAKEFSIDFPLLFDASGGLAQKLKPTHMPEAFVVTAGDSIAYRGRIDDRFEAVGKRRAQVSSNDLIDAIGAVARGKKPRVSKTEPVGCLFEGWPETGAEASPVTYNRDIAPILNANCVECHRPGGVAPFSLHTYGGARRKAKMSAAVAADRIMPPWKADADAGTPHFRNERRLTRRQIDLLAAWAEAGAPEGDPDDLLPAPEFADDGWRNGTPDLIVTMPEAFEVPADGDDIYRYFVIPTPPELQEDRVLVGIDFKPGDPTVVHHSDYFIDYSGKARRQKSEDGKPGFSVSGTGGFLSYFDSGFLGAWAPGSEPYQLADGQGMAVTGGGDIVLEIHYHPTGKVASDRSSLGFYFAKKPVDEYVSGLFIGTQDVKIPAGAKDYWREVWMDVPGDLRLLDIGSHMHYLGKESHIEAVLPGGEKLPLLSISDWDLNWQTGYFYREPVILPKGSRIHAKFRYDNSATNSANPHSPPRQVGWGWGTDQEMCEVYLTVIAENEADWPAISKAMMATWARSGDPGRAKLAALPIDPTKAARRLASLSLYEPEGESLLERVAGSAEFDALLEELRKLAKAKPDDPGTQIALGSVLGLATWNETSAIQQYRLAVEADTAFDRAIELDRWNWDAWMAKSELYGYSEDPRWEREAIRLLEELIRHQKSDPKKPAKYQKSVELLQELRAKHPAKNR